MPVPVRAGTIVVFSSLTPHATGHNITGDVRKAYILQFAPDGAVAVPVKAGSIIVFSSLTPHTTGHNTTDDVRKAYIVQYAPAGAYVRTADGDVPCDDSERQFPVLRDGEPV